MIAGKVAVKKIDTLTGHAGAIYASCFYNNLLYTAGADKYVVRWNVTTQQQDGFVVKLERPSYALTYLSSSAVLLMGESTGKIHVVDTKAKEEKKILAQHRASIFSLTYDKRRNQFYSGDRNGVFCAWDASTFQLLLAQQFHCGRIKRMTVDEETGWVVLACQDGQLRFVDGNGLTVKKTLKVSDYSLNGVLLDGDKVVVGGRTAFISVWNWQTEKRLHNFKAHNYAVYDLAFLDNKTKLVSASFDKSLKIWSLYDFEQLDFRTALNDGHRSSVNNITKISEKSFATVSDDRKIKLWTIN